MKWHGGSTYLRDDGVPSSVWRRRANASKNYLPQRKINSALQHIEEKAERKGIVFSAAVTVDYFKSKFFASSTDWVV
eukprot:10847736-Lingulodinium_polyedra.AAC.1